MRYEMTLQAYIYAIPINLGMLWIILTILNIILQLYETISPISPISPIIYAYAAELTIDPQASGED